MDVRVLICRHPGNLFQVTVMTSDLSRRWGRVYSCKHICATDLGRIGLLTIMDAATLLASDFDSRAAILTNDANVETVLLKEAGFVEIERARVN